ncbi:MAG: DUF4173 domain-containing protein [Ruminococcus sp.]|nr:DUF4173 domain-containing protein [Ruminococcus sp.]
MTDNPVVNTAEGNCPYTPTAQVTAPVQAPYESPYEIPRDPYRPQHTPVSPVTPPVAKSGRFEFTAFEKGFALVALVLGYLFNRFLFSDFAPGLGALIFFETALVCGMVYLLRQGAKLNGISICLAVVLLLYPVSFILSDNDVIKGFGALFEILLYMYWMYSASAGLRNFRQSFLGDALRSVFVNPFKNFVALPVAVFKPAKNAKTKVLRYVLIGLLVTIPFTAVIAALLLSSDEAFRNLIGIENLADEIGEFIVRFIFAIPVAMIIFSVLITSTRDKDYVKAKKGKAPNGRMNHIVFVTAFIPVILLYGAFFISQFAYFTNAFQSILPEEFTYAEYARQGFFELCAVVAINILMVVLTMLLCKKKENGHYSAGVKLMVCVLCLCSAALVAISVAKMIMYTSAYGLTHLRIYTLWLTAVMLLLVAVLFVKILAPKVSFWSSAMCIFLVMFLLLSLSNVDMLIAKYNVQWYKEGKIGWMGEEALYELDHSAVPYLDELFDDETKAVNEIAPEYQYYCENWYQEGKEEFYSDYYETVGEQVEGFYQYLASFDNGFVSMNLPESNAQAVFAKRGIEPFVDEYALEDELFDSYTEEA